MWIVYAVLSSFFAGVTAILAKCGIQETNSHVVTALRTSVVLLFSWLLVFMTGVYTEIPAIDMKTLVFLILSGLATGASWLCYFRALQLGDINKVVPIDKSSTVITIILAMIFLHEVFSWKKGIAIICITIGTMLMMTKSKETTINKDQNHWLMYAIFSALFASATAILGKVGIENLDSHLGTAIRTTVVFFMSWMMVFVTQKQYEVKKIKKTELLFIILSGVVTGLSWLFYYRALQQGLTSVVVSIDKLSILVTLAFSKIVFKETFSTKTIVGIACILIGTFLLMV